MNTQTTSIKSSNRPRIKTNKVELVYSTNQFKTEYSKEFLTNQAIKSNRKTIEIKSKVNSIMNMASKSVNYSTNKPVFI